MKHPAEIAQKVLNHIKRLDHRLDKKEKDRLTCLLGADLILANNLRNPAEEKKEAEKQISFWSQHDDKNVRNKQVNYYQNAIMRIDCAVRHGIAYYDYVLICNG